LPYCLLLIQENTIFIRISTPICVLTGPCDPSDTHWLDSGISISVDGMPSTSLTYLPTVPSLLATVYAQRCIIDCGNRLSFFCQCLPTLRYIASVEYLKNSSSVSEYPIKSWRACILW